MTVLSVITTVAPPSEHGLTHRRPLPGRCAAIDLTRVAACSAPVPSGVTRLCEAAAAAAAGLARGIIGRPSRAGSDRTSSIDRGNRQLLNNRRESIHVVLVSTIGRITYCSISIILSLHFLSFSAWSFSGRSPGIGPAQREVWLSLADC